MFYICKIKLKHLLLQLYLLIYTKPLMKKLLLVIAIAIGFASCDTDDTAMCVNDGNGRTIMFRVSDEPRPALDEIDMVRWEEADGEDGAPSFNFRRYHLPAQTETILVDFKVTASVNAVYDMMVYDENNNLVQMLTRVSGTNFILIGMTSEETNDSELVETYPLIRKKFKLYITKYEGENTFYVTEKIKMKRGTSVLTNMIWTDNPIMFN